MKFFNKHKGKIASGIILAVILVFAFWWGGDTPDDHGFSEPTHTPVATEVVTEIAQTASPAASSEPTQTEKVTCPPTTKPTPAPKLIPTAKPVVSETSVFTPTPIIVATEKPIERTTCTLSIRCDTILSNMASLDSAKAEIVPQNGVIYSSKTVEFIEGESAFDVLLRETRRAGIHFEFEKSPIYGSAYIEGIGNIYEFDCGSQSGWMYKVNGMFPKYGCSDYKISNGDRIEFVYTCSSGKDIGGSNY